MKRFKRLAVAVLTVLSAATYVAPALPAFAQSSSSLSIAPKKNYLIEPGKSVKDKLTIRNLDNAHSLDLTIRVIDFTFTGDGGTPKLFLDPNAPQTTWSLKPFLTVPKSVSIPKGGSKSLDMSVAIPAGHGAGSYYSAIIYQAGAPETNGNGNVGLSASGVTLVFTQIPGKVNEDLKMEKLGPYTQATSNGPAHYLPYIVTDQEPQMIGYTLKNSGNVTEAPVGSITLKGWFGAPITINNVNPTGSLSLIGQSRTYTACIKLQNTEVDFNGQKTPTTKCVSPGLWPGMYTISLDLFYGQNGNVTKEITGSSTFWYLPWWFIILCLIVLAIVAYYVWRIVRKIRGKSYGRSRRK